MHFFITPIKVNIQSELNEKIPVGFITLSEKDGLFHKLNMTFNSNFVNIQKLKYIAFKFNSDEMLSFMQSVKNKITINHDKQCQSQ